MDSPAIIRASNLGVSFRSKQGRVEALRKENVKAPFSGILLYIIGTPPCNEGEPLFEVGRVKEK